MPFFGCCKSSDVAPRGDPSPSEALRVESLRPPATSPARVRAAPLTPLGPKRAAGTVQPPARAVSRPATRMRRLKRAPTADALARTVARGVRADEAWNENESFSRPKTMASPKRPSQQSDESATVATPPPAPDVTAAPATRRISSPLVTYMPAPKPAPSLRAFAALFDASAGPAGGSPAPNPLVAPPRSSLSAASAAVAGSKSSGAASHRPSRSFEPPSEGPLARAASQHAAPRDASPEQSFHLDESDEEDDAAAASFVL
uniref:Uncharacterized protein n=1 Tax=Neobodo designis TaxID=312471 RepID=A0A7S1QK81_NEODS|mmetsp:Transcript_47385/g.146196  ORF Transcript_47385/g.146196 Transcript_47385/m.146196 type:complete len:260 (+) Transcript_47385:70-849(+)